MQYFWSSAEADLVSSITNCAMEIFGDVVKSGCSFDIQVGYFVLTSTTTGEWILLEVEIGWLDLTDASRM